MKTFEAGEELKIFHCEDRLIKRIEDSIRYLRRIHKLQVIQSTDGQGLHAGALESSKILTTLYPLDFTDDNYLNARVMLEVESWTQVMSSSLMLVITPDRSSQGRNPRVNWPTARLLSPEDLDLRAAMR